MRFLAYFWLTVAFLALPVSGDEVGFDFERFPQLLREAGKLPLFVYKDEPEIGGAIHSNQIRFQTSTKNFPERLPDSLRAGLQLYALDNQHDYLLVSWYREPSREKRLLISSLILCSRIGVLLEPRRGRTDFELGPVRFKEPEATERREEFEYVKNNAPMLAKELHRIYDKLTPLGSRRALAFDWGSGKSPEDYANFLKEYDRMIKDEEIRRNLEGQWQWKHEKEDSRISTIISFLRDGTIEVEGEVARTIEGKEVVTPLIFSGMWSVRTAEVTFDVRASSVPELYPENENHLAKVVNLTNEKMELQFEDDLPTIQAVRLENLIDIKDK